MKPIHLALWCALALPHIARAVTIGDPAQPQLLPAQIADAYKNGERQITIAPGTYLLPHGDHDVFHLTGWKNAVISAPNVTLISSEFAWNRNLFVLDHCENVTLQGATLSQSTLSFIQGTISFVGKNAAGREVVNWKPDAGYPTPAEGESKIDCFIAQRATKRLKPGVGDFWGRPQQSLGDGTFQIEMDGRINQIAVGDVLVGRYGEMPFKVQLLGSRNCTLRDLTMNRNGFSPIREEGDGGGGNHILGVKWTVGPKPDGATAEPLVNSAADGLHSTGANPGPDIENCDFQGIILDDPIAIHGSFQEVVASNGTALTLKNGWADLRVGEPIRVYDDKGFMLDANVVAKRDNGDETTTITLDKAAQVPIKARATNPLSCGPNYKIIGNHIQGTRSRGILVKGDGGIISGNVIENCGLSAISVGPEYYWNEASYVRGARIEDNVLRGNGFYGAPTILIHGEGAQGNTDIRIARNRFEDNWRTDIEAQWTRDLSVENNSFSAKIAGPPAWKPADLLMVAHSSGVQIAGNRVENPAGYARLMNVGDDVSGLHSDIVMPVAHDGSPADTNLVYVGRWDKSDAQIYRSNWGGAYVRARFSGTSVRVKGGSAAGGPNMMVSLDGAPAREVPAFSADNLAPGEHLLMVGAPNQNSELGWGGLELAPGAHTLPMEARPLIEFVGDSITTGGGQTRPGTINYAWQSAEMLGADHTQIAFSGRALTTGYGCADDKAALDTRYFQLKNFNHLQEPQAWDFSYQPAIVVINLGQNDQCGGEPAEVFERSYASFVRQIRARLPRAHIVALRPFGGPYENAVRQAVAQLQGAGDAAVSFVDTTDWLQKDDYVDGIHPTQSGHDKVAAKLAPILKPLLKQAARGGA